MSINTQNCIGNEDQNNQIHKIIQGNGEVTKLNEKLFFENSNRGIKAYHLDLEHNPYIEKGYKKCIYCGKFFEYMVSGDGSGLKFKNSNSCCCCNLNGQGEVVKLGNDIIANQLLHYSKIEFKKGKDRKDIISTVSNLVGVIIN